MVCRPVRPPARRAPACPLAPGSAGGQAPALPGVWLAVLGVPSARGWRGDSAPLTDEQFARILENIKKANNIQTEAQFEAALKAEGMTLADLRAAIERVGRTGNTTGLPRFMTASQSAAATSNFGVSHRVDPNAPGATGRTTVAVTVNADGTVRDAIPVTTAFGDALYDGSLGMAAANAAKNWRFEPGQAETRSVVLGFNFTPDNTSGAVDVPVVRIGGSIKPPAKLRDVKPVYPKEAQEARIQGVQIIEASLGPSGDVLDARALRGQPPLIGAAMDAVLQWKFTPWDGPERRMMTVTVNFTLDNGPASPLPADAASASAGQISRPLPTHWPIEAVRVGGNIKPPNRVVDVKPVYPKDAQDARVQGVVIFELLIGPDGKVKDARVLRSIPMLDQAAEDAVRQWEFTPTLLNGNPIPVIMTVTVNFTLS